MREGLELSDKAAMHVHTTVLQMLNIQEQEFAETHRKLAQDPKSAHQLMAAQQGKIRHESPTKGGTQGPSLDRMKMMQCLDDHMNSTINQMAAEQQSGMDMRRSDPMAAMLQKMVAGAKLDDELWLKYSVEKEEFDQNMHYYMSTDPEFRKCMDGYMDRMR